MKDGLEVHSSDCNDFDDITVAPINEQFLFNVNSGLIVIIEPLCCSESSV